MNTKEFLQLAKKRYITIIGIVLFFIIVALAGTLLQPLKYRSKTRLLIAQSNMTTDAYAIARSNQYIGGLISEVVYSGAFLDSLESSDAVFDRNYFNGTYKQNIKKWKKTVFARSGGDSGIIDIEIYHPDPSEAKKISLAVNELIISGKGPYQFANNQVKITTIDQPIISSFPVKPNIPLNLLASLIFGLSFSLSYIYFFPVSSTDKLLEKKRKTVPALTSEPVYQTRNTETNKEVRPQPVTPANLPVYAYEESLENYSEPLATNQPIITNWINEEPINFKGNINNVLGE
jgi:capsular polysaccharide biosynthesis protein